MVRQDELPFDILGALEYLEYLAAVRGSQEHLRVWGMYQRGVLSILCVLLQSWGPETPYVRVSSLVISVGWEAH